MGADASLQPYTWLLCWNIQTFTKGHCYRKYRYFEFREFAIVIFLIIYLKRLDSKGQLHVIIEAR